jgi:Cu/Ag efflux protein CusF
MLKRLLPIVICSFAASAALAQVGGGGMGGGGGHARGGGEGRGGKGPASRPAADTPPTAHAPPSALNKIEIVGVVQAIDPAADRMTIAYESVEALGWPAGAQPFPLSKHGLLEGVTVGEKIRFNLDSSQVSALRPY